MRLQRITFRTSWESPESLQSLGGIIQPSVQRHVWRHGINLRHSPRVPPTSGAGGRAEAIRREADIARAASGHAFTLGVKGCIGNHGTGSRVAREGRAASSAGVKGWRPGVATSQVAMKGSEVQPQLMVCLAGSPGIAGSGAAPRPRRTAYPAHGASVVTGYPAQHDSLDTSISKVCAASFKPSTVVRYGKIISPNSVKVRPCLMASAAV